MTRLGKKPNKHYKIQAEDLNEPAGEIQLKLNELRRALKLWITSGVCQGNTGAFHAWRDAVTDTLSYEYPEISGYALTYLANNRDITHIGYCVADWLINRLAAGNISARIKDGEAVYNFDLAMIAMGLLSWGLRTKIYRYISEGLNLVTFIQTQILSDGCLQALSPAYPSTSRSSTWSTDGRSHLLKVVQCLLTAYYLGLPQADTAASILIKSAQELQANTGRFITHAADTETNLHAALYAAEGLWIWGTAQNDADAIERSRRAVEWVWSHQLHNGGFPNVADHGCGGDSGIEQSDVLCQAIRLALLLKITPPGLALAIARVTEVSYKSREGTAILYRPTSDNLHQNTWATLFGIQAVEMITAERASFSWRELV